MFSQLVRKRVRCAVGRYYHNRCWVIPEGRDSRGESPSRRVNKVRYGWGGDRYRLAQLGEQFRVGGPVGLSEHAKLMGFPDRYDPGSLDIAGSFLQLGP